MKTYIYNIFTWHLQEHLMWSDQQMPFVANQFNTRWEGKEGPALGHEPASFNSSNIVKFIFEKVL